MKNFLKKHWLIVIIAELILAGLFYTKSGTQAADEHAKKEKPALALQIFRLQEMTAIPDSITLSGRIEAIRDIQLMSETQGIVQQIHCRPGQFLKQGFLYASVESSLKDAALGQAQLAFEKAAKESSRMQTLFAQGNITQQELENAQLALKSAEFAVQLQKKAANDARLRAPFSGMIAEQYIHQGSALNPGTPLLRLLDLSTLRLKVSIAEQYISSIKIGQKVLVYTDAWPGIMYTGIIQSTAPMADESGNFPVYIEIPNNNKSPLKAGMTAHAQIECGNNSKAWLIPRIAFTQSQGKKGFYILRSGKPLFFPVEAQSSGLTEMLPVRTTALASGDTIIVQGFQNIRPGTNKFMIVSEYSKAQQ
jgi:RND family efflux transporter MFP subunit